MDDDSDDKEAPAVRAQGLTPPYPTCNPGTFEGHGYWFCPSSRTFDDARASCRAVGYDLVNIGSADENLFVQTSSGLDVLIGGNDKTTEGVWRWADNNAQFWSGSSWGTPVGGAYSNWDLVLAQPDNNANEDCSLLSVISGLWFDVSCTTPYWYVCEEDTCPNDPLKGAPGQCGCGTADTDTDGDGTANCRDRCPNDAKRTEPGQCGCVGDTSLKPSGTACGDGYCAANNKCDGAGSCGTLQQCAPSSDCTVKINAGHAYAFCRTEKAWAAARTACKSIAGMDLVHVDRAEEDAFINSNLVAPAWLGATDSASEGKWLWSDNNAQFWSGAGSGSAVGGAYHNWYAQQPDDAGNQDCAAHKQSTNKWRDEICTSLFDYVCEASDLCPNDPNKVQPGVCGCGLSEVDTDRDGTPDCNDGCPYDPARRSAEPSGCDVPTCQGTSASLTPIFQCVYPRPDGTRLAVFDVQNSSACVVNVPLGTDNTFLDGQASRGQPTRFMPGVQRAITVPITGTLRWRLAGKTATATPTGAICEKLTELRDAPVILTASKDFATGAAKPGTGSTTTATEFEIPRRLPVTLGNAANGTAQLTYREAGGAQVTCTYRGGSSVAEPDSDLDRAKGRSFHLQSCSNGLTGGSLARGTQWTLNVLGGDPRFGLTRVQTHVGPGCSGLLEPALSPEETVNLRQQFVWENTTALPVNDSQGLPAMRYALIYVESDEQVDALRRMKVYFRQRPIFASQLERYNGKCGTLDNSGDSSGVFVFAIIPAALYNYWRDVSLQVIRNNQGKIPFRAVVLPPIPDAPLANPDGTLSWQAIKAAGFQYFEEAASTQQPLFGLRIPIVDDAIEAIVHAGAKVIAAVGKTLVQIGRTAVETTLAIAPTLDDIIETSIEIVEATWETATSVIGDIDEFVAGSVRVRLDFTVLHRDPAFDLNGPMLRAWGPEQGTKLVPHGVVVEVLRWRPLVSISLPTRHTGEMGRDGRVSIKVAKGGGARRSGLCVHMENDAAMISAGITENEFCNFNGVDDLFDGFATDIPTVGFHELRGSTPEFNYLTQLTDSYDYVTQVMGHTPKQAEVSVGTVANLIGDMQPTPRPFVACLDYNEMSNSLIEVINVFAAVSGAVAGPAGSAASGALGVFAQPFVAKDIFLPDVSEATRSRGVVTHEYGHFLMCDIYSSVPGSILELYLDRLTEGFDEAPDDATAISMESFADIFAGQVASGFNYTWLNNALPSLNMYYCIQSPCIEQNFRALVEPPQTNPPRLYSDEIRRLVSTYHDAFDRSSSAWKTQRIPTNADAWQSATPFGTTPPLVPAPASYLADADDAVALSGPAIQRWIGKTRGGGLLMPQLQRTLASTMFEEAFTWCQVCPLFAAHDRTFNSAAPGTTLQGIWQACTTGELASIVGPPPNASLRMSYVSCATCPPRTFSDANGQCQYCPGVSDVVVGNACVSCASGSIAVGDACQPCASNAITVGNVCQVCPAQQIADRATNTCVDCPADVVIDATTLTLASCGGGFFNITLPVTGDLCPDTFWLQVDNLASLTSNLPVPSALEIAAYGFRGFSTVSACTASSVSFEQTTVRIRPAGRQTNTLTRSASGTSCTAPGGCNANCRYTFGAEDVISTLTAAEIRSSGWTSFRIGLKVPPTPAIIDVFAAAVDRCPSPD